ncbi:MULTISPECIES: protease HtpX [Marichromatium]|uniref:Protease HtpX n=1 Tax=Marichromatium gracile TaxID=1048 RepID=A0A4R4A9Y4_MARGR|nr:MULTISPECIES: protease HtpX [Marichromatium]MBO8087365.1 protease HtpX [Marichromatium sp.]KXX63443.1 zinc metalloprotease HtpX [Marichromatium gracile]MBK1708555.1 protease HtpX [Marichromatium gracile]RNE89894.1 protease HtpX [Marichromatium sp. AB31]RNE94229.1 protease HtpX [Marichromatium sp. AB32]
MMRIFLFLATNLAILVVISVAFRLFGIDGVVQQGGLDMGALLLMAAIIGFSGSLISLFLSKTLAKHGMRVQIIEQPSTPFEQWLLETVARQSERAGIRMPEVGIFDSPQPNAFATGWNRNDALVAVSTGLLQHMNKQEVEAVVGHEISHVANGDMVTLALIQGVVNTFVVFLARIIGHTVDRVIFKNEEGPGIGYFVVSIIAEILLSVLATMIVMWFSRYREFRADAGGAALTSRRQMADALRALQRVHEPQDLQAKEFAAFGISGKIGSLFSSHPPLERRIAALEQAG